MAADGRGREVVRGSRERELKKRTSPLGHSAGERGTCWRVVDDTRRFLVRGE
jgi:hypothetical protein